MLSAQVVSAWWPILVIGVILSLIFLAYVLGRAFSIAWFKTKREHLETFLKETKHGDENR